MPYIKPEDRQLLNPYLVPLRKEIVSVANDGPNPVLLAFALLRHAGFMLTQETALNTAERHQNRRVMRYWMAAANDGVLMEVGRELVRRKELPDPSKIQLNELNLFFRSLPQHPDARQIDPFVQNLIGELTAIADRYNQDAAFAGPCNYSLTMLGGGIAMDLFPKGRADIVPGMKRVLKQAQLQMLAYFWFDCARVYYNAVVAPYEDRQIETNGDVEIYQEMDKWLEEDG